MDPDKRVFVSIYCKIYANSFSESMINVYASGTEIYGFLLKSAGVCFDPDGFPLPGDCNLWYLGCCEKFGHMVLGDDVWNWSHGQSSFDTVEAFALKLHEIGLSTEEQHQTLMAKIEEGRQFDCMFQIWKYLDAKDRGLPWVKEPDPDSYREYIKSTVTGVKESLEKKGYEVHIP
jgi:hypothetical protein